MLTFCMVHYSRFQNSKLFLYINFLGRCTSFWSIWTFSGSASSCPHWVPYWQYSARSTRWCWQVLFQPSFNFPKISQYSWTVFLNSFLAICPFPTSSMLLFAAYISIPWMVPEEKKLQVKLLTVCREEYYWYFQM